MRSLFSLLRRLTRLKILGRDFVHGEQLMIGLLSFAIGQSHVSGRLPRPHASKPVTRKLSLSPTQLSWIDFCFL